MYQFAYPVADDEIGINSLVKAKKYLKSDLKIIGEHYHPGSSLSFINQLCSSTTGISKERKIGSLNDLEFQRLILAIEKLCDYVPTDDQDFHLLPKITAKIENGKSQEDTYLIDDTMILSKKEAIQQISSHRLDGVIVHEKNGKIHLRSRPNHCIRNIKTHETLTPSLEGQIETLFRNVGKETPGQCLWAFINGISNTKDYALKSAELISRKTGGEQVLSMPNDTILGGIKDCIDCIIFKLGADTPIVQLTVRFFRYLLHKSFSDGFNQPIIIFVHSQGAIISKHALEILNPEEREKIRIFTFGGGSFIAPGKCHPDSHNYASAVDLVCCAGSPNLRLLALRLYLGNKEGLSQDEVIRQLSIQDAILVLDSTDEKTQETFINQRMKYYKEELNQISNVTILDPDADCRWKHEFKSDCYQETVRIIVIRYQKKS